MRRNLVLLVFDQLLIFVVFWIVAAARGYDLYPALVRTHPTFLLLVLLHLLIAFLFDKYNFQHRAGIKKEILPLIYANFSFVGLTSIIFLLVTSDNIPRVLFFGTVALVSSIELMVWYVLHLYNYAKKRNYTYEAKQHPDRKTPEIKKAKKKIRISDPNAFLSLRGQIIRQSILEEIGPRAFEYLKTNVLFGQSSIVLSVNRQVNILNLPTRNINTIVNLQKVNNHRYVNKFFEAVNARLPVDGVYVGFGETKEERKKRFFRRYTPFFGFVLYCFDFAIHRVVPKLPFTRKLYFSLTGGKNRVMSRAEILGRLYSCGFELIDESQVGRWLFFVARKVSDPHYDNSPTYGPLIRLKRVGKGGKIIGVYKMRSMHPYAEYLQPYIHEMNSLEEEGKFNDDFRISTCGKIMRKLWLDEQPMWINWLKGDLKLVGVRPLSEHYFSLYTKELQEKRIKVKPGLIPPYYADMPKNFEEIMASEDAYIDAYLKRPFRTDWVYFWKAFGNIVFRSARSK